MIKELKGCGSSCVLPLFGLLFSALGCVFLLVFGRSAILDCARVEARLVTCTKQTVLLGIVPAQLENIDGLQRAWVEESCDESCTYRVVLETERRTVPLTPYYTSAKQAKYAIADRINDFVDSRETTLHIQDGTGRLGIVLPVIFVVVGMLFFAAGVLSLFF